MRVARQASRSAEVVAQGVGTDVCGVVTSGSGSVYAERGREEESVPAAKSARAPYGPLGCELSAGPDDRGHRGRVVLLKSNDEIFGIVNDVILEVWERR